jgi:PAS domain S-box-containing protein
LMREGSEAVAVEGRMTSDPARVSDAGLTDDAVRAVVEAAPDGIILADEGGQILLANAQIERMFGYPRGQLLGRSVDEMLPESLRQVHRAHRRRYRAEPRTRPMGASSPSRSA